MAFLQKLSDFSPGIEKINPGRGRRAAEDLGDLDRREPFVSPQTKGGPFFWAELFEDMLGELSLFLGIIRLAGESSGRLVSHFAGQVPKAAFFLEHVQAPMEEDGIQPAPEAEPGVEILEVAKDLDKGLLADILGIFPVSQDIHGYRHDASLILVHDLFKFLPVSPQAGRDPIVVFHRSR